MIGKVIKGRCFRGTLAYLFHGNNDKPKDSKDVKLIGGNMVGRTAKELTFEFNYSTRLRPDIKRHVVHIPLSLADGEYFSDAQWREVAERHLNNLGYNDNQWAMVRHSDTDHDHVHIVACSIRWDGTRVNDSMDFKKCARSRQGIELDYGLKRAAKTPDEAKGSVATIKSINGQTEADDRAIKAKKDRIKEVIKNAGEDRPSMTEFISRLKHEGVNIRANLSKTTKRVSGISFYSGGDVYKGSKLGKAYAWKAIQDKLVDYDEDRDHEALSLATAQTQELIERHANHDEQGFLIRKKEHDIRELNRAAAKKTEAYLNENLPKDRLENLERLEREWEQQNNQYQTEDLNKRAQDALERYFIEKEQQERLEEKEPVLSKRNERPQAAPVNETELDPMEAYWQTPKGKRDLKYLEEAWESSGPQPQEQTYDGDENLNHSTANHGKPQEEDSSPSEPETMEEYWQTPKGKKALEQLEAEWARGNNGGQAQTEQTSTSHGNPGVVKQKERIPSPELTEQRIILDDGSAVTMSEYREMKDQPQELVYVPGSDSTAPATRPEKEPGGKSLLKGFWSFAKGIKHRVTGNEEEEDQERRDKERKKGGYSR